MPDERCKPLRRAVIEECNMIATNRECKADRPSSSELVTKLRLLQLQHSEDPRAAAIATVGALLLDRLDRLLAAMGVAA